MKWGSKIMHNKPENVYIDSWLPQDDILAHPNVKLFISHCGIGGIVEAKYHAVPIIATPLIGDQFGNAKKVENEGWGKVVDLKSVTEEELINVIKEVLKNSR
jgi:UDP:flavonoid glycosyltransferase YjiC (YdhE family)